MPEFIAWSGFFGAWLLVAGPIYQAAIELDEEDFERPTDGSITATTGVEPPRVSLWWLLLPPVAYVLLLRARNARDRSFREVMSGDQLEHMMHYKETAAAWILVASGACLIALKETWELREEYEWSSAAFWAIVALMAAVCVANTSLRVKRRNAIIRQAGS